MATAWPWCARFRARFEPMTAMPTTPMSAVAVLLSADAVAVSVIGAPSLAAVGSTLARAPQRLPGGFGATVPGSTAVTPLRVAPERAAVGPRARRHGSAEPAASRALPDRSTRRATTSG